MIVLIRHGHAEPGGADAQRALSDSGRAEVMATAGWLDGLKLDNPRWFSSPYLRAQQTARLLGGTPELIRQVTPDTPSADAEKALSARYAGDTIVCFHQPLLASLVLRWTGQSVAVPTGAGFCLSGDLLAPDWMTLQDAFTP